MATPGGAPLTVTEARQVFDQLLEYALNEGQPPPPRSGLPRRVLAALREVAAERSRGDYDSNWAAIELAAWRASRAFDEFVVGVVPDDAGQLVFVDPGFEDVFYFDYYGHSDYHDGTEVAPPRPKLPPKPPKISPQLTKALGFDPYMTWYFLRSLGYEVEQPDDQPDD